jgi:RNA-directed DNA polymerase
MSSAPPTNFPAVLRALARSLLGGELSVDAVCVRAARTLGRDWNWLRPLALRYVQTFEGRVRPRHRDVIEFLKQDRGFRRAIGRYEHRIRVAEWLPETPRIQPIPAAQDWNLPAIATVADLADWLSLFPTELDWFADLKHLNNRRPKLQHYHYRLLVKRSGGVRLIETPKATLKALQRRVLSGILDRVPVHPDVHGFVSGRSIVTYAQPHVRQDVLLRLDLENFFPAFPAARIQALFRTLGYPETVADRLGGLCSNSAPAEVYKALPPEARTLYARPHLPQGAPTSPALANLMAYRLDCRLSALARTAGGRYTRYADDLAFSGGAQFRRGVERFAAHAAAIRAGRGSWRQSPQDSHHATEHATATGGDRSEPDCQLTAA